MLRGPLRCCFAPDHEKEEPLALQERAGLVLSPIHARGNTRTSDQSTPNLLHSLALQAAQLRATSSSSLSSLSWSSRRRPGSSTRTSAPTSFPDEAHEREVMTTFHDNFLRALMEGDAKWALRLEDFLAKRIKLFTLDDRTGQATKVFVGKGEITRKLNRDIESMTAAMVKNDLTFAQLQKSLTVSDPQLIAPSKWIIKTQIRRGLLRFNFTSSISFKHGLIHRIRQGR